MAKFICFSEIQSFLQQVQLLGKQEHIEYCLERLHTVIFNVTTIRDILCGNSADPILGAVQRIS